MTSDQNRALDYEALKKVALAAMQGRWWATRDHNGRYEIKAAGAISLAALFSPPGWLTAEANADHIATFDPPTVLALIARAEGQEPGTVKMPETEEEAAGMALLGEAWLREHAPHRLRAEGRPSPELVREDAFERQITTMLADGLKGRTHDVWERAHRAGLRAALAAYRALSTPPPERAEGATAGEVKSQKLPMRALVEAVSCACAEWLVVDGLPSPPATAELLRARDCDLARAVENLCRTYPQQLGCDRHPTGRQL